MEIESSPAYMRENLRSQLQELEQKIALLDGTGQTGPELDALHAQHATLTEQLEQFGSESEEQEIEMEKAA